MRREAIVAVGLFALVVAACDESSHSPTAPPDPVTHPDLSPLPSAAQRALQSQRSALDETVAARAGSVGLAEAFGAMGRRYHGYGLHQAAASCYENARHHAPRDARWPYYLAVIQFFEGQFDDAIRLFTAAIELDDELEIGKLRLADVLLERGAVKRAQSLYQEAQGGAWASFGLGRAALLGEDFETAVSHFEAALQAEPGASAVHHPLATAYRRLGRAEQVQKHLALAGTVPVSRPDQLMTEVLGTVTDAMSQLGRGGMAAAHGRHHEALPIYREAVATEPESAAARLALGTALARLGSDSEAATQLREAVRLSPEDPQTHFHLASHLLRSAPDQDGVRQAVQHFERATSLDPLDAEAALGLAQALEMVSRFEEALDAFERTVGLDPQNQQALLGRASCLLALSRYGEARAALARLVEEDPGGVVARTNLGALHSRQGRRQEAVEQFETVLRLGGDDSLLAVVHFNLAVLTSEASSPETVRRHYELAVHYDDRHVNAHANLGSLLFQMGELASSAEHLGRARELAPMLVEVRILEAKALAQLGRIPEARALLEQGRQIMPSSEELRRAISALGPPG